MGETRPPWEMTQEEYCTGEPTVHTELAEAFVGVRGAFKKRGAVDYVMGERYRDFTGVQWQIVGYNDLNVPYVSKVVGNKVQKTWFVGRSWEVHKLVVEKALREGKVIPPRVLQEYPELVKPEVTPVMAQRGRGMTAGRVAKAKAKRPRLTR